MNRDIISNRVRMKIRPLLRLGLDPEGVDGNIHTNWLLYNFGRESGETARVQAPYILNYNIDHAYHDLNLQ